MLWPVILPIQLTAVLLIASTISVTVFAAATGRSPKRTFAYAVGLSSLAFVPSCIAIGVAVDYRRFGIFKHDDFDAVNDFRVERYLPPSATNIVLDKYSSGYRAKFAIDAESLDRFIDEHWDRYGDQSVVRRGELSPSDPTDPQVHQIEFGDLGWPILPDGTERFGPMAPNGAGFSIWYSPSLGIAYQRGSYR